VDTTTGNDQGLVESARAGDRKALEALLARYQPHIYRFGMKMCGDPEDAKDVLQETLLAVTRNLKDFRGGSAVSTWLYTIARSFCVKKRRRSKFAPEQEQSLDQDRNQVLAIPHAARGPDEEVAGKQIERALEQAIGSLEPMYREVLVLRDVEGLTASEVGEVLGLSVEAVKSRLHRARIAVRNHLAPLLGAVEEERPGCPDIVQMLSRKLEEEISPDLCRDMENHVAQCPRCKNACDSLRRTLALCRSMPAPTLPTDVEASVRQAITSFLATRS